MNDAIIQGFHSILNSSQIVWLLIFFTKQNQGDLCCRVVQPPTGVHPQTSWAEFCEPRSGFLAVVCIGNPSVFGETHGDRLRLGRVSESKHINTSRLSDIFVTYPSGNKRIPSQPALLNIILLFSQGGICYFFCKAMCFVGQLVCMDMQFCEWKWAIHFAG